MSTVRMGGFLQQVSTAASTQAGPTQRDQSSKLIQQYGYWLGSPEDNAAIGLRTNWHEVVKSIVRTAELPEWSVRELGHTAGGT